ncbi:MAG: proteasome assembly chaperone family protein, partial [Nitrosopumilus sp.]
RLRHPFRFYGNKEGTVCAIICEITLRMEGLYTLVSSILDWAAQKGSKEIVILDGVASTEHDGKAYCAAEEDLVRTMADKDISMIPQGFITGIPGGILNECLVREIQGLTLLARANKEAPDSAAAATLIEALNRFYDMKIDTSELQKQKDRINTEFSELSQKYAEHREEISGMYM